MRADDPPLSSHISTQQEQHINKTKLALSTCYSLSNIRPFPLLLLLSARVRHEEKVQPVAEGVVMLPSWLPHVRLVPEFFQYPTLSPSQTLWCLGSLSFFPRFLRSFLQNFCRCRCITRKCSGSCQGASSQLRDTKIIVLRLRPVPRSFCPS